MNLKMKSFFVLFLLFSLFTIHYSLFTHKALAVCPVCTVAVGAGLGISRWLGIDDSVSGIWVGGLIISLSFWTSDWLERKYKLKSKFKYLNFVIILSLSLLVFLPLAWSGIIGHPANTVMGIDRLIFGSLVGAGAFLLGIFLDRKIRETMGKQLFTFQKVILPVVALIILSFVVYFYGGYLL